MHTSLLMNSNTWPPAHHHLYDKDDYVKGKHNRANKNITEHNPINHPGFNRPELSEEHTTGGMAWTSLSASPTDHAQITTILIQIENKTGRLKPQYLVYKSNSSIWFWLEASQTNLPTICQQRWRSCLRGRTYGSGSASGSASATRV